MHLTARDDSRIFVGPFHVTNICSICGKDLNESLESTVMHHEKYDNDRPLAYTKEVCISCHNKITASEQAVPLDEAVKMLMLGAKEITRFRRKRDSWNPALNTSIKT